MPIVFRVDTIGDGNNNQTHVELFGHPMVVRVPSRCSSESLRKELAALIHYKEPFRLLLVDGQVLDHLHYLLNRLLQRLLNPVVDKRFVSQILLSRLSG